MAHRTPNLVLETSTTTGTGNYTLAGAVTGYLSFSGGGLTNGDTVHYVAIGVDANGNPNGDGYEVGLGTWNTGGTLTRTTILSSSNSNNAVNWSAGTRRIFASMPAQKVALPDIQTFTGNGTWTKPAGLVAGMTMAMGIGGGGGGGSGRRGTSGTNRGGGSGGSGGEYGLMILPTSLLGSTESVTVGVGGGGAAAVTTDDTNGNNATAGGDTGFGAWMKAPGGTRGTGGQTGFAQPDATTTGPAIAGGTQDGKGGAGGQNGSGFAGGWSIRGGGGGGGGGGIGTGNTSNSGAAGAPRSTTHDNAGAGSAGTSAGNGGNGGSVTAGLLAGGAGGGGGGSNASGAAGNGGNGGSYGGGGGGGGASVNGNNSGAGGDGGPGICVVISW